jgi:hypothetical protein
MKFKIEGTRNNVRWPEAGGIVDLPEREVNDLVAIGYADRVDEEPAKAVARKAEKRG